MKNVQPSPRIVAALAAALLSVQSTHAAVTTWNNAAGGNWSLGANWDTLAAPGTADDTRFMNTGAGTPTTMDVSRTNNSLLYGQGNQGLHTTTITAGQALTVSRAAVGDVLYVGTAGAGGANTLTPVTITGSGGTLKLSGTGDLVVRQGDGTAGSHRATLDLSGLDALNCHDRPPSGRAGHRWECRQSALWHFDPGDNKQHHAYRGFTASHASGCRIERQW